MAFLLDIDTQTVYQLQNIYIEYWEWLVVFVLFFILTLMTHRKKMMRIEKEPEYRYYVWGFYAKFFASVFFVCLTYYFSYGGDTIGFFSSSMSMANLFYKNPEAYFQVLFSEYNSPAWTNFDFFTGFPWGYLSEDPRTFIVIKIVSPFAIISNNSYLISSILIGYLSYRGSWKLFKLFYSYYPNLSFQMAISILFIPSALFYGSGILKDTFTYMSVCLFTVHFHQIFIDKSYKFKNVFYVLLHAVIIIAIKPYIFMILLPGLMFWAVYLYVNKINSKAFKIMLFPIIIVSVLGFSVLFFSSIGGAMDKFSVNQALKTASVTQYDLKQSYYDGKSFDIGNFDGSATSALLLFPKAIFAGMFRPIIFEVDSALVLLSALENLFLLYLFVRIFFRGSLGRIYTIISTNPLLIFCIIFSLFFAYMLGLTTSNFGALTRFKIPMLPFFTAGLFIINHKLKQIQNTK